VIPEGPHRRDVPLRDIIDILLTARPVASSPGSRPRRTSSRCTRWRIAASAVATSTSFGAGAG